MYVTFSTEFSSQFVSIFFNLGPFKCYGLQWGWGGGRSALQRVYELGLTLLALWSRVRGGGMSNFHQKVLPNTSMAAEGNS